MMPSLVEMAKANNTSKRRKQQRSSWTINGAALGGAGALGSTFYGLRALNRGRPSGVVLGGVGALGSTAYGLRELRKRPS